MATIQQLQTDNENQNAAGSPQTLSTGGSSSSSVAPSTGQYSAPERKGSGRFTNIQSYLDANKGAGEQLASNIGRSVEKDVSKTQKQAEDQSSQIAQNIQSEKDRLARGQQYNQQIQQGQAGDVAAQNLDEYTRLRTGQSDIENLQNQQQQFQNIANTGLSNLQNLASNAGTESGRFNLLRQAYGGGMPSSNYGLGQRRLDQLFLQAEGGGQLNQLQNQLGQQVGAYEQNVQNLLGQQGTGIQDVLSGVEQAKMDVANTLGQFGQEGAGAFGQLYTDLQSGIGSREQEIANAVEQARKQLGSGQLTKDIATELGITGPVNMSGFFDLNPWADKITAGDTEVTMADIITDPQMQNLSALQQLSGIDPSEQNLGIKEGNLLNFETDEFLRGAQESVDSFNRDFFNKKVSDLISPTKGDSPNPYMSDKNVLDFILANEIPGVVAGDLGNTGQYNTVGTLPGQGYGISDYRTYDIDPSGEFNQGTLQNIIEQIPTLDLLYSRNLSQDAGARNNALAEFNRLGRGRDENLVGQDVNYAPIAGGEEYALGSWVENKDKQSLQNLFQQLNDYYSGNQNRQLNII